MTTKILAANFEWQLNDADIVNPNDAPWELGTPATVKLWLLHDHGFT